MMQIPPKTIVSVNLRLIKYISLVNISIKRFDWGEHTIFHWFKVYLAKIVNDNISHLFNPF